MAGLPLLGLILASPRLVRAVGLWTALVCALVALAYPDRVVFGFALGIFAAIHALGVVDYWQIHHPITSLRARGLRRVSITIGSVWFCLTMIPPAVFHLVLPVGDAQGGTVLIRPQRQIAPVVNGEPVAFNLHGSQLGNLRIAGGLYYGRVLASASERVNLGPDLFRKLKLERSAFPWSLDEVSLVIPEDSVLVLPYGRRWGAFPGMSNKRLMECFIIPESALVGRPHKRWFWRTQTL